jgi:hypothetical protein
VLLSNISYIIKDISYLNLFKVEYIFNNKEFVFNLNLLIFKRRGDVIYKRITAFKLNYIVVGINGSWNSAARIRG